MATDVTLVQGESKVLAYSVVDADGDAVNVTGATITWELSRSLGGAAILTKSTTGGDIDIATSTVEVTIDATDTEDLEGLYWHELTITDLAGNGTREFVDDTGTVTVTASPSSSVMAYSRILDSPCTIFMSVAIVNSLSEKPSYLRKTLVCYQMRRNLTPCPPNVVFVNQPG